MKKNLLSIILSLFIVICAGIRCYAYIHYKSNEGTPKKQSDIEKRLSLLEFSLISQSPKEVANTWAKGVMTRNGALQYAVLCDNLRLKCKSDFDMRNWIPGCSSPWIDTYKIIAEKHQSDGTWKFLIKFHYTDSTNNSYSSVSNIVIGTKKIDIPPLPEHDTERHWCITKIDTILYLKKEQIIQGPS